MAVHLRNADQSLLPSRFYDLQDCCDDTSLSNSVSASPNNKPITTTSSWSSLASSDSILSSQVASEVGSTETESDPDEDFMAELTRQMAHFMFQDDDKLEKVVNLLIKLVPFLVLSDFKTLIRGLLQFSVMGLGWFAARNTLATIRHEP